MNWSQIIIQLGVSALVIYVGYQLALKLIAMWTKADTERTAAFQTGMGNMAGAMRELATAFRETIGECNESVAELGKQMTRIESRIDTVLDLTPIRTMRAIHESGQPPNKPKSIPKVIVASDHPSDQDPTPPQGMRRATPAKGMPYGPFTRQKTEVPK